MLESNLLQLIHLLRRSYHILRRKWTMFLVNFHSNIKLVAIINVVGEAETVDEEQKLVGQGAVAVKALVSCLHDFSGFVKENDVGVFYHLLILSSLWAFLTFALWQLVVKESLFEPIEPLLVRGVSLLVPVGAALLLVERIFMCIRLSLNGGRDSICYIFFIFRSLRVDPRRILLHHHIQDRIGFHVLHHPFILAEPLLYRALLRFIIVSSVVFSILSHEYRYFPEL